MSFFRTWDDTGKNLVDSDYVAFGLIKSGYMVKLLNAQRRTKTHLNSTTYDPIDYYDEVHGFTVTADTPIVFIAGQAVLQQIVRNGNSFTFWYAHASTATRYYVFDMMKDRGSGPAKLRLWTDTQVCTLDSSMPFLDINGSRVPASPSVNSLGYGRGYLGASTTSGNVGGPNPSSIYSRVLRDALSVSVGGGDCAVSIPWTRVMFHTDQFGGSAISAREGAFGQGGNVVFMMATEAGCSINSWVSSGYVNMFYNIPGPRKPAVTYIDASTLPLPFG